MMTNQNRYTFPRVLGIALFLCASMARAQMGSLRSYQRDNRSIEELRKRANNEQTDAIFALGFRNDAASIPLLKHLAETPIPTQDEIDKLSQKPKKPKNPSKGYLRAEKTRDDTSTKIANDRRKRSSLAAKMALTRMGQGSYFDEFVAGLSTTSYEWKTTCIEALGYMNDKRAVKFLGPLLYQDSRIQPPPDWPDDVSLRPYNVTAAVALSNLLPEEEDAEFKDVVKRNPSSRQEILLPEQWRRWWERNKDKYTK